MRKFAMRLMIAALGLAVLGLAAAQDTVPDAQPTQPTTVTEPEETTVFSSDLHPDYTQCREGLFPCGEGHSTCLTQDDYAASTIGPQFGCPIIENPSPTPPSGVCALLNNKCSFSDIAPTCVSWLRNCASQYSCSTREEYDALSSQEILCSSFSFEPPTPTVVCVPVNDSCERYDPCAIWQGHCFGEYMCGSEAEYAAFRHGPIPICAAPPAPLAPVFGQPEPTPEPVSLPMPEGECLYRDGECQWSACRSWLGHCQMNWNCGSEYDFQVFQTQAIPSCANPGPFFVPPQEPGVCEYDIELGRCEFRGQPECTGGREYQSCGSACPLTCDNYRDIFFCLAACFPGCYCPEGTVLNVASDQCVPPSNCLMPNVCEDFECQRGHECQVFEPTGEAFCEPNCKELNPCEPNQECVITQVQCVRAPCPGVLSCEDKVPVPITLDLQLSGESSVLVEVQSDGARFIRIILRDSNHRRQKDLVVGSSGSVTFSGLPSGVTRVKAIAFKQGGSRPATDWQRIVVP